MRLRGSEISFLLYRRREQEGKLRFYDFPRSGSLQKSLMLHWAPWTIFHLCQLKRDLEQALSQICERSSLSHPTFGCSQRYDSSCVQPLFKTDGRKATPVLSHSRNPAQAEGERTSSRADMPCSTIHRLCPARFFNAF